MLFSRTFPISPQENTTGERTYLDLPCVGVGVVVWRGDQFLLIKRGKPPRLGQWSIPGGLQELGETVREAAAREIKEETNIEIEITALVDVIDGITHDEQQAVKSHYTLIDFAARYVSGEAVAGDDAMDVGWFRLEDLANLDLWETTNRVIRESADLV
jgi:8-oxo-dGTP diphosphatase